MDWPRLLQQDLHGSFPSSVQQDGRRDLQPLGPPRVHRRQVAGRQARLLLFGGPAVEHERSQNRPLEGKVILNLSFGA